MWINWVLLALALVAAVAAVAIFVRAVRQGHFADLEDVKYSVLRAEPEEDASAFLAPGRPQASVPVPRTPESSS